MRIRERSSVSFHFVPSSHRIAGVPFRPVSAHEVHFRIREGKFENNRKRQQSSRDTDRRRALLTTRRGVAILGGTRPPSWRRMRDACMVDVCWSPSAATGHVGGPRSLFGCNWQRHYCSRGHASITYVYQNKSRSCLGLVQVPGQEFKAY